MTNLDQLRAKVSPPVTWATLDKYVNDLFVPINRGECVTTIWSPMAGRRLWNKFIIENVSLFPDQINHGHKFLLVYIEPLDLTEQSTVGYLRLVGNSVLEKIILNDNLKDLVTPENENLFKQDSLDYSKLLNELKLLFSKIIQRGVKIVLIMGEFDELEFTDTPLFNNLKSLWNSLQPDLHYVFLLMSNVDGENVYKRYKDLVEVLRQNVIYIPLRDKEDATQILINFFQKSNIDPKPEYLELMLRLCGGHPYLLKLASRLFAVGLADKKTLSQIESFIENHYEIKSICRSLYETLGPNSKFALEKFIRSGIAQENESLCFQLGFLKVDKSGKGKLFSQVFEKVIRDELTQGTKAVSKGHNGKLEYNNETGAISMGGEILEDTFTRQEYELVVGFLKEPNKLKSRDEIGTILWGNNSFEKYSDWAIDQIISKLRKKLVKMGLGENIITTIRGRGYKLAV